MTDSTSATAAQTPSPEAHAFQCMQRALSRPLTLNARTGCEARRLKLAQQLIAGPNWGPMPPYPTRPACWPEGLTHLPAAS